MYSTIRRWSPLTDNLLLPSLSFSLSLLFSLSSKLVHPNENDSASGGLVQTPIIERTRVPRFSDRDTYYHQSPLYLPPLSRFPLTFRSRNSIRVLYPRSIDRSNNGIVIYFPARSVRIPSFPPSRGKRFTGREIESSEIYGLDSRLREGELRIVDGGTAGKHATGISTSFVETEREIRYETRDKFRFVNNPFPIRLFDRRRCLTSKFSSPLLDEKIGENYRRRGRRTQVCKS